MTISFHMNNEQIVLSNLKYQNVFAENYKHYINDKLVEEPHNIKHYMNVKESTSATFKGDSIYKLHFFHNDEEWLLEDTQMFKGIPEEVHSNVLNALEFKTHFYIAHRKSSVIDEQAPYHCGSDGHKEGEHHHEHHDHHHHEHHDHHHDLTLSDDDAPTKRFDSSFDNQFSNSANLHSNCVPSNCPQGVNRKQVSVFWVLDRHVLQTRITSNVASEIADLTAWMSLRYERTLNIKLVSGGISESPNNLGVNNFNPANCMSSIDTLLTTFRNWALTQSSSQLYHLLTSCYSSGTVGLAYKPAICGSSPAGVSSYLTGNAGAQVVIHELGHNFGADHVTSGGGIMRPSVSPNQPTEFSQSAQNNMANIICSRTCFSSSPNGNDECSNPTCTVASNICTNQCSASYTDSCGNTGTIADCTNPSIASVTPFTCTLPNTCVNGACTPPSNNGGSGSGVASSNRRNDQNNRANVFRGSYQALSGKSFSNDPDFETDLLNAINCDTLSSSLPSTYQYSSSSSSFNCGPNDPDRAYNAFDSLMSSGSSAWNCATDPNNGDTSFYRVAIGINADNAMCVTKRCSTGWSDCINAGWDGYDYTLCVAYTNYAGHPLGTASNRCAAAVTCEIPTDFCSNKECGDFTVCGEIVNCGGPCSEGRSCETSDGHLDQGRCFCDSNLAPQCSGSSCGNITWCSGQESIDCGGCGVGQMCSGNQCVAEPCTPLTADQVCSPYECYDGPLSDGCGNNLYCSPCLEGTSCNSQNVCEASCSCTNANEQCTISPAGTGICDCVAGYSRNDLGTCVSDVQPPSQPSCAFDLVDLDNKPNAVAPSINVIDGNCFLSFSGNGNYEYRVYDFVHQNTDDLTFSVKIRKTSNNAKFAIVFGAVGPAFTHYFNDARVRFHYQGNEIRFTATIDSIGYKWDTAFSSITWDLNEQKTIGFRAIAQADGLFKVEPFVDGVSGTSTYTIGGWPDRQQIGFGVKEGSVELSDFIVLSSTQVIVDMFGCDLSDGEIRQKVADILGVSLDQVSVNVVCSSKRAATPISTVTINVAAQSGGKTAAALSNQLSTQLAAQGIFKTSTPPAIVSSTPTVGAQAISGPTVSSSGGSSGGSGSSGLSGGEIAGIVVGSVAGMALVVGGVAYVALKPGDNSNESTTTHIDDDGNNGNNRNKKRGSVRKTLFNVFKPKQGVNVMDPDANSHKSITARHPDRLKD